MHCIFFKTEEKSENSVSANRMNPFGGLPLYLLYILKVLLKALNFKKKKGESRAALLCMQPLMEERFNFQLCNSEGAVTISPNKKSLYIQKKKICLVQSNGTKGKMHFDESTGAIQIKMLTMHHKDVWIIHSQLLWC